MWTSDAKPAAASSLEELPRLLFGRFRDGRFSLYLAGAGDTLRRVTFLEAATVVLKASRRSLTAGEITEAALCRGLIQTNGKTPEATMSAALYGAPVDGPIQREYDPGRERAIRGSVRWRYLGQGR